MSNRCRCFHTTFRHDGTKLLIRLADDAVAEGRQATGSGTWAGVAPGISEAGESRPVVSATRRESTQAPTTGKSNRSWKAIAAWAAWSEWPRGGV